MKIGIILGTRPEIIKMSPIIRLCEKKGLDYFILHSGQHYSYHLDKVFFDELKLPDPLFNLEAGSGSQGEQTGKMLAGIEKVLLNQKPDVILVQGDTNTVLAGALAAIKIGIMIGHVEAGLRSNDRSMPEEINRVLTDYMSSLLFCPTQTAVDNLAKEGITKGVYLVGDVMVDALEYNRGIAEGKSRIIETLGLQNRDYLVDQQFEGGQAWPPKAVDPE